MTKKERDPEAHREAQRKYGATWRKNHPKKVKALAKLWTEKRRDICDRDPDKVAAIRKAAREKRREVDPTAYLKAQRVKWREQYKKHPSLRAAVRAKNKKQREKHPDAQRKYAAKWRKKNPEYAAKWRKKNPEIAKQKNLTNSHKRRTLKARTSGTLTGREFRELCSFHGDKCLCCGVTGVNLTADHVIPLSFAGRPEYLGTPLNSIDNIQPLCKSCNSKKHAKHIDYRLKGERQIQSAEK